MSDLYLFRPATIEELEQLVADYCGTLSSPMDSYVEDLFLASKLFEIIRAGGSIGFAALHETGLVGFYVVRERTREAAPAFAAFLERHGVTQVYFQTSDPHLVALVSDWEWEKRKGAYFFEDVQRVKATPPGEGLRFVQAQAEDFPFIDERTEGFFSPDDIKNGEIYMLLEGEELLGCGIAVRGRLFCECASIGMVTCRAHRGRGVARYILLRMKEWCYGRGLSPVAGCWYYNTLSRRSLESAGMGSRARGIRAVITGREDIPTRTGNPPGELV